MADFYDTHCHLYLNDFNHDLDEVINRAREKGISKILSPGIDVQTSRQSLELSEKYHGCIFAAAGIHPNYASKIEAEDIHQINQLSKTASIKAIGEIGLDYYRTWSSHEDQIVVFREMLKIAEQNNLPVCLHCRDADDALLAIMDEWYESLTKSSSPLNVNPGVFHSYNGSKTIAAWAVDHHFKLGISGPVTFKNSVDFRDTIVKIGIDHLILETDAPYLAPQPVRGKRNEPANIILIAQELANITSTNIEQVSKITNKNADDIYNWADG